MTPDPTRDAQTRLVAVAIALLCGCGDIVVGDPQPATSGGPDRRPSQSGEPPPPPSGACCEALIAPGCEDATVAGCVCSAIPSCCTEIWGPQCAVAVQTFGCGLCPEPADCCETNTTAGCADLAVQLCVCASDPLCCQSAWDSQCVENVEVFGCGTCSEPETGSTSRPPTTTSPGPTTNESDSASGSSG